MRAPAGSRACAGERGYVLMDYFAGALIFFSAFGGFMALAGAKANSLREAEARLRAVQAAESYLARLRAGEIGPGRYALPGVQPLVVEVELAPLGERSSLRRATVQARWREGGQRERSVRLETVLR